MQTDFAIQTNNLGKCYHIYDQPVDRLKQSFWRGRKRFYKEFWALRNISLEINNGETIGVIGSNGSGKSTLLQLICGTLTPTEGEVQVNGRVAALLELGAGFNPEFTGRDNVFMNASIVGLDRVEVSRRYDEIASFANIGPFIDQPVKTYSSGMHVRLAFATAVNVSPDILLIDEALAVGDIRFQQKCMSRIKKFCRTGTVVFVSHDTSAVIELCSRTLWIEGGEIRMDGEPKLVVDKYIEYMYEGDASADNQISGIPAGSNDERTSPDKMELDRFLPVGSTVRQFGDHRVTIERVRMVSGDNWNGVVYSGKPCDISLILEAHTGIDNPIVGFFIRDRLGRDVIGDSTTLLKKDLPPLLMGHNYHISFQIKQWPNLRDGDYVLCLAVADGILEDHMQCHFLHDVLTFKSIPTRTAAAIFSVLETEIDFFQVDS